MNINQINYLKSRVEMHRKGMLATLHQLESTGEAYKYGSLTPNVNLLLWKVIKTEATHSQYTPRFAITPEIVHQVKPRHSDAFPNLTLEERCRIEYIYYSMAELIDFHKKPALTYHLAEDGTSKASIILEWDQEVPSVEVGYLLLEAWKLPIALPPGTPVFVPELSLGVEVSGAQYHALDSEYMVKVNLKDKVRIEVHGLTKDFVSAFQAFLLIQYGEFCIAQLRKPLEIKYV